jgi:glyoxylase-like metal-dependent hydrolase (beta-lactamase superfamily II)
VAEKLWAISGPANDLMYLVAGSNKAMLVDTGMGIGDLAGEVKCLTNLPLLVVNTHGHPDHGGGNGNFDEIWIHPADIELMQSMCSDEYRVNDVKALLGEGHPDYQSLIDGMVKNKPYRLHTLKSGQIIDLGNRQFEVIEIPGHTPGCIGLLCSKEKILFTGDSVVETPVWLYLKHSKPVLTYWESLKKIKQREEELELLLPGHQPYPLTREHLSDLITCSEEIIHQPGIGEFTQTFAGEGLLWRYGKVSIIYDPENVQ